jgi:hypothetical protein
MASLAESVRPNPAKAMAHEAIATAAARSGFGSRPLAPATTLPPIDPIATAA